MAEDKKRLDESLEGVAELKPKAVEVEIIRSFEGVGKLRPKEPPAGEAGSTEK